MREQSLTTAGDQECSETVAMARQRGYIAHPDRSLGNGGFTNVIISERSGNKLNDKSVYMRLSKVLTTTIHQNQHQRPAKMRM